MAVRNSDHDNEDIDIMDPWAEGGEKTPTHALRSAAGSIFINNTSYSGADIKVLVHIYDPANASLLRYQSLLNEVSLAEQNIESVNDRIATLRKKISGLKQGNPETELYKTELSKLTTQVVMMNKNLDAMSREMKRSEIGLSVGGVKALGELQTLSISTNRDKVDVRALGHVGPKGRCRGQRSYAGTMVFTVFNRHVFSEIMQMHATEFDGVKFTPALLDQMPPIDITIVFANEYGHTSRMAIYGVDFATEGMVMSIQDMFTEQTVSFYAYDIDPMRSVAQRRIDENYLMHNEWAGKTASDLIFEEESLNDKEAVDVFARYSRRQNPYI